MQKSIKLPSVDGKPKY